MTTFRPSPAFVNFVVNHPTVRATTAEGRYIVDTAPVVEDDANVVLATVGGVCIFRQATPQIYEGHIYCVAGHRGRRALELVHGALNAVFERPAASIAVAFAPLHLPAVAVLCRRAGFVCKGRDLLDERYELEVSKWNS